MTSQDLSKCNHKKKKSPPSIPTKVWNPDTNATVEAAIASVSPSKEDTPFFDGMDKELFASSASIGPNMTHYGILNPKIFQSP